MLSFLAPSHLLSCVCWSTFSLLDSNNRVLFSYQYVRPFLHKAFLESPRSACVSGPGLPQQRLWRSSWSRGGVQNTSLFSGRGCILTLDTTCACYCWPVLVRLFNRVAPLGCRGQLLAMWSWVLTTQVIFPFSLGLHRQKQTRKLIKN